MITIVGFTFSLVRAASYETMPNYEYSLAVCEPDFDQWLSFLSTLKDNQHSLVNLDLKVTFDGEECNDDLFSRTDFKETISDGAEYYFSPQLIGLSQELFGLDAREIIPFIPDNGTTVRIEKSDISLNRYTSFQFNIEGLEGRISGPVQVDFSTQDAFNLIEITSPVVSDRDRKALECIMNDWNILQRAIFCPFL